MEQLNVSNIQHFSTGDGPGIRTTVFLKGCNLRCPWCHNPENISAKPQRLFFEKANKEVNYGRFMTVDEVIAEVMEDLDFYKASGGGVTVSGGEPLLQSKAVAALCERLKEEGISTVIDTAGDVPWENFERVLKNVDIFYFDYKSGNAAVYSDIIGGSPDRIRENLRRLIAGGHPVQIRIPVIPDINTADEACEEICRQLSDMGIQKVDLLPFHRMGSGKYDALGMKYEYAEKPPLSAEEISRIATIYKKHFTITIEK